ncbi:MAG: hypothetical protein LBS88_01100 [Tannerellaceae bacterium]|nr:hypothetical protein [Tannerellaceae bacterium]
MKKCNVYFLTTPKTMRRKFRANFPSGGFPAGNFRLIFHYGDQIPKVYDMDNPLQGSEANAARSSFIILEILSHHYTCLCRHYSYHIFMR